MKREPDPGDLPRLAPQPITTDVLREKYLKGDEATEHDLFRRVARAWASVEAEPLRAEWERRFLENLEAGAIGAGRIMSAAGTRLESTLINCFVQPVGDSIQGRDVIPAEAGIQGVREPWVPASAGTTQGASPVIPAQAGIQSVREPSAPASTQGYPGIYEALREAAETMRRGGGVGYDFSRIRPRGAEVKSTGSIASGPCSYMDVFDHSCSTVESAGSRRGAQMGVLRIDHPDVLEFITAKRTPGRWNNFNVSVAVPDEFMRCLQKGGDWSLVHKAKPGTARLAQGAHLRNDGMWVYRTLPARELWDTIMQSTYDFAEPGILFMDTVNRENNLRYAEVIETMNPCGEQPLPPYGCCNLGPVILTRFVRNPFGFGGAPQFDFDAFAQAVAVQVRALDNVLELTHWPLPQQRAEAMAKRRIGVGFTGLGNTLCMLNLRYDAADARDMAASIARCLRDSAYGASVALAREKGPFPLFDAAKYLEAGTFASRLDDPLKQSIRAHGIRNSHLLSIAPTGTVSLAFADNASNGIEPPFAWTYRRKKREADGSRAEYDVEDHAWRLYRSLGGDMARLPASFVSALEMPASAHLAMMEAVQPFIDTAISKTVNIPADYPYEDFKGLYVEAWRAGLKGLATYRPNEILGAVLEERAPVASEPDGAPSTPAAPDAMRSVIESRPKGTLPGVVEKLEFWTQQGQQTLYLVVSFLPLADGRERAIEFFMPVGQSAQSQQWITSSMRLLSLAARGGFLERALADMRKVAWDRGPVRLGTYAKADGTAVPLWHDSEVAAIAYAIQNIIARRKGEPVAALVTPAATVTATVPTMSGAKCPECGAHAMIRRDGCDFCTQCGHVGTCG